MAVSDVIRFTKLSYNGTDLPQDKLSLTLPEVAFETEDDEGGFMKSDIIVGLQKLTPKIKIHGMPAMLKGAVGMCQGDTPRIMFWGSYDKGDCQKGKVSGVIQGGITKIGEIELKKGKVEVEIEFGNIEHYELSFDNEVYHDIRPKNDAFTIAGTDIMSAHVTNALS